MHAAALHKRRSTLQRLHRIAPRPGLVGGGGRGGSSAAALHISRYPYIDLPRTHAARNLQTGSGRMRAKKNQQKKSPGAVERSTHVCSVISYGHSNKRLQETSGHSGAMRNDRSEQRYRRTLPSLSQETEAKVAGHPCVNSPAASVNKN